MRQVESKRLEAATDKLEIGELQSRYMFALDWREPDLFASLFTEDAVLEWAEGHAAGRDAIRAACVQMREFYSKLAEGTAPKKPPRLRHFVGNRVIDVHGDNASTTITSSAGRMSPDTDITSMTCCELRTAGVSRVVR